MAPQKRKVRAILAAATANDGSSDVAGRAADKKYCAILNDAPRAAVEAAAVEGDGSSSVAELATGEASVCSQAGSEPCTSPSFAEIGRMICCQKATEQHNQFELPDGQGGTSASSKKRTMVDRYLIATTGRTCASPSLAEFAAAIMTVRKREDNRIRRMTGKPEPALHQPVLMPLYGG